MKAIQLFSFCCSLVSIVMLTTNALPAQELAGDWHGLLEVQNIKLRLVFHLQGTDKGYQATMDSPDQGAKGIPVPEVQYTAPELLMKIPNLMVEYRGTFDAEKGEISGVFKQGAANLPLNLRREALEKPATVRPQDPKGTFPYKAENVHFEHEAANVRLAGTLTLPEGAGPHPAVVLITGSGPQNRDEEIMGHKPFLIIADHLTRRGIAVLRYDDRGVGESTGDRSRATSADYAGDAQAAVAYLRTRPEVDPKRIGLAGHSEGGLIAPMVAAGSAEIAFIILLAGPGVPGDEIVYRQQELINRIAGAPAALAEANLQLTKTAFELMKTGEDLGKVKEQLKPGMKELLAQTPGVKETDNLDQMAEQQLNTFVNPWFRFFISFDPATALEKVTCPVLALNGDKDLQVDSKQNLPKIEATLQRAGNKKFTIKELPGLNHLFQTCKTGLPNEYAQIEETFSPAVLEILADWILDTGY